MVDLKSGILFLLSSLIRLLNHGDNIMDISWVQDRPSTKVHAAPGGGSSLGYLIGGSGK